MVCLILSYPPFNSRNNGKHRDWILDILEINHKVTGSRYKQEKELNVSELSSEIDSLFHHSIHDLEAFIPAEITEEMPCRSWFSWYTKP